MMLETSEIAKRESAMVLELTGQDITDWLRCVADDAENANKSVADYVPGVGYNVKYFSMDGIKNYIEGMVNTYIRTWYDSEYGENQAETRVYLDGDGIHKYEVKEVSEDMEKVTCFELMGGRWVQLGDAEYYSKSCCLEITFGMKRIK